MLKKMRTQKRLKLISKASKLQYQQWKAGGELLRHGMLPICLSGLANARYFPTDSLG